MLAWLGYLVVGLDSDHKWAPCSVALNSESTEKIKTLFDDKIGAYMVVKQIIQNFPLNSIVFLVPLLYSQYMNLGLNSYLSKFIILIF